MLNVPAPEVVVPVPVPAAVTLKEPVVPAKPPVPLVMAMVPGPLALDSPNSTSSRRVRDALNVPVRVPVVLPVVIVNVIGIVPDSRAAAPADALNVPLAVRPPENATVPDAVTVVVLIAPDPFIVI